ncbi:MAG: tRNA dihydrouridine synthase DusB [Rhodospirillales bacterium]|nr:tRNA dihydrouridine synthase DusB [Rhodospirillales bacterium]MCW9003344.1 tRNA dihydrouridine synthase DusB [Rhodospirillales bacterium]
MALRIGSVVLNSPVVLAPMSGVTDMPFRRLVKSFGVGLVVSEMIASQAMIRANRKTMKIASPCADEYPMSVQLAGCEPEIMAEAARLNVDRGASIIDINMGCPVKKVIKGDAGAALMRDERLAGRIIEAVVKSVDLPVTVKMRLGWDDSSRNAATIARIAQDAGAQAVTVHGRTRAQFYKGQADWEAIMAVKDAVKIPVIGNGDVASPQDALKLLEKSGADGVMVGRATYGQPWLLMQIERYLETGETAPDPSIAEQLATVLGHYDEMLTHYGSDAGMRIARKHLGWYSKGLKDSAGFRAQVNHLDDPNKVRELIRSFYTPIIETAAA